MSTTVHKFMVPAAVREPRGAAWAAAFSATLAIGFGALAALGRGTSGPTQRFGSSLWRGLEGRAEARARRDLLALAERRQLDSPSLARELREAAEFLCEQPAQRFSRSAGGETAAEAAAVRESAYRLMEADPRFAAELFAAADRHEQPGPRR